MSKVIMPMPALSSVL